MGFTFALDSVDSIEMDFAPLIERGLSFVKVSARTFAQGLVAGESTVPTQEIRQLFEEAGLQLVVDGIETEAGLEMVAREGVLYGQGDLFAPASPCQEVLRGQADAAA
jgi:EAL domain-containing protein (putative c-di-GMP-specific phosphodiesterase class I)